jgi:hypothetical protein
VAREGSYEFELRRWPREADLPLTAPAPEFHAVDGSYPAGKSLAIGKAKLTIGDREFRQDLKAADKFAHFTVPLTSGPTKVQTWFYDKDGKELCGAYYVYVHRNP